MEELLEIVGILCCVLYLYEWGLLSYYNVMVIDIDILDDNEVMVLVLFCNSIYEGMFSCEYYIEGKCKFSVDQCRFFYGDLVKFEDFREYIEFNYSLLKMEFFCLVFFIDGFWYRVVIVDILDKDY